MPAQAFFAASDRGTILVSEATFRELTKVLARSKFDRYLTLEEREHFLLTLLEEATMVEIHETVRVCRDPNDVSIWSWRSVAGPRPS